MGFLSRDSDTARDEMWKQFADECGGRFQDGGLAKGKTNVQLFHRKWVITLDTFSEYTGNTVMEESIPIYHTRMRAPYINSDGFWFETYPESIFSPIGKLFGSQDIVIGDPSFDGRFIIKASSEIQLRKLLENERLKRLIMAQPDCRFEVKGGEGRAGKAHPDGVSELHFSTRGIITNIDMLKSLYDMFALCLDQLCLIGLASKGDPGIRPDKSSSETAPVHELWQPKKGRKKVSGEL